MKSRITIIIMVVAFVLAATCWSCFSYLRQNACQSYAVVESQWREQVLSITDDVDPRRNEDQLAPLVGFSKESVSVNNFSKRGEGWSLDGNLADVVALEGETYFLYGRENRCYFRTFLSWNNTLDQTRSFSEFLILREVDGIRKIRYVEPVGSANAAHMIGLRLSADGKAIEVLHGAGNPQVGWIYTR